jgi:hypothetical protein
MKTKTELLEYAVVMFFTVIILTGVGIIVVTLAKVCGGVL